MIKKRSEFSPFELIENRFARTHGRSVHGGWEQVKHICKILIVIYFILVSYLTEWMLCLNTIK